MADEIAKIKEKYGRIDILVNNAGVSDSTPLDKYTAEHFANVMDLNVNAMMNGILPATAIMKEQGGGCILNTSSMVSICGQPGGVAIRPANMLSMVSPGHLQENSDRFTSA